MYSLLSTIFILKNFFACDKYYMNYVPHAVHCSCPVLITPGMCQQNFVIQSPKNSRKSSQKFLNFIMHTEEHMDGSTTYAREHA
jgi:hypothetical protein